MTTTKDIKQMAIDIAETVKLEYPHCDPYEARDELVKIYMREEELTISQLGHLIRVLELIGL